MAAPKRRKASLHSAGKVTEQDLLERARALADDPSLATPVCEGGCILFSPVKAAQRAIPRIHAKREDEAALNRATNSGNDLARAYAATLLLARSGRVPVVADIKMAGEKIPYVMRGNAKPFFLAGLQHYDDRALRLLSVAPWTKKRGIHFYSADRGIICTGKRAAPPEDFVREEAALLELSLTSPGHYSCGHDGESVSIEWVASGTTFERCLDCAAGTSTIGTITRHMAAPKPGAHFRTTPRIAPIEARAGNAPEVDAPLPTEVMDTYLAGRLPDAELVTAAHAARLAVIRKGPRIYMLGEISYGEDTQALLDALGASENERRAVQAALDAHTGAVVVERSTLARLVAELWPEHGKRMLEAVSNEATATRLFRERPAPDEAMDLIRKAARAGAGQAASAGLPSYSTLPSAAAAADAVARTFRTSGRDAAVRLAQERASTPGAKPAALAMLTALGAHRGQEWRFTGSDREVADALAAHVEVLLRGAPEGYHDALAAVSRGSGETATFERR